MVSQSWRLFDYRHSHFQAMDQLRETITWPEDIIAGTSKAWSLCCSCSKRSQGRQCANLLPDGTFRRHFVRRLLFTFCDSMGLSLDVMVVKLTTFVSASIPALQGKSQARMWESQLIRKIAREGYPMQSVGDARTIRPSLR